jgi:outer membrane biosynthesis protein TonB
MASLDSLPADQRAVLQLVLQRGRSYDEIARLLSIDRAAVRQRALTAFDLLGPQTGVEDQRRALITDYLLGQLPAAVAAQTRDRLAESPGERAWARVLASELAPLTKEPLPEIPPSKEAGSDEPFSDLPGAAGKAGDDDAPTQRRLFGRRPRGEKTPKAPKEKKPRGPREKKPRAPKEKKPRAAKKAKDSPTPPEPPAATATSAVPDQPTREPGSSRLGGAILILLGTIAVVVVVVVLVGSGGSSKNHSSSSSSSAATGPAASATTTASSSGSGKVLAQINLTSPVSGSKAVGIADVLKEGTTNGIAIVAQNVTPNTTKPPNAYAVWLYNSASDAHILGFVNPGVGKNERLSTAGALPTNAAHFHELIVTLETKANPTAPGTIVLQGTLSGVS